MQALSGRGDVIAALTVGSPPPWGEGARVMGAGCSPCGVARRGGACAVGPSPAALRGLQTAPILGGAEGGFAGSYKRRGICAPDLRGRRGLMCDMRDYRLR